MTLAATLVMIVCMTFRIPFAFQGAIYALMISRESPRATLQSAATIFACYGYRGSISSDLGAVCYQYSRASFSLGHRLFVPGFLCDQRSDELHRGCVFAIMSAVGIPLWDRHVPAETNVEDTLWLCLAVLVAVVITAAVELAFVRLRPGDEVVLPISGTIGCSREFVDLLRRGPRCRSGHAKTNHSAGDAWNIVIAAHLAALGLFGPSTP